MAEILEGWTTQANLPLGPRTAGSAKNLAQDYLARLVQALIYTPNTKWSWYADSDGTNVSKSTDPSLTAGDCVTLNGVIVPFQSNSTTGITAADFVDAIASMNLPEISVSIDTGQVKVESSGADFTFGGRAATLTSLGLDTTPTDSATTTATWPLALQSFVATKWKQADSDGLNYSWVILKGTGVLGGSDGYLCIAYNPSSGDVGFFDSPVVNPNFNGDNFSFCRISLWTGAPTNVTGSGWVAPTFSAAAELPLNGRWQVDSNVDGKINATADVFKDEDVRTDDGGGTVTGHAAGRYVVLREQPILGTGIGNGITIRKVNEIPYPGAAQVFPASASSSKKGCYIYLPTYSSALAPLTAEYLVWDDESPTLSGAGTTLQIVPMDVGPATPASARPCFMFVSVQATGAFTAWFSRVGNGFLPTNAVSPMLNFTGYKPAASANPVPGMIFGAVTWAKDASPLAYSKSIKMPGLTQVANVLRTVGRLSHLGLYSPQGHDNNFQPADLDLPADFIHYSQLAAVQLGTDNVLIVAGVMLTSQRGSIAGVANASSSGIGSIAGLLKLDSGTIATLLGSLLGLGVADEMVDAGSAIEPNLDPLSGDALFFEIPAWALGISTLLTSPEPVASEYRGVLDGIKWAPATLTEGSVLPKIATADNDLIFVSFGDWDLSAATLTITGGDGIPHSPNVTAVTDVAELEAVLRGLNIPGMGYRKLIDGAALGLTSTSQITIVAGGTFAAQTGVSSGTYYGSFEQVKVRDCVIPYVTRQSPRL